MLTRLHIVLNFFLPSCLICLQIIKATKFNNGITKNQDLKNFINQLHVSAQNCSNSNSFLLCIILKAFNAKPFGIGTGIEFF
jgi:hypothetical protein